MHHQAAAIDLVAMPAAEIIRAMPRIQEPMKINRKHAPDETVPQKFFDLRTRRRVTIIERDAHTTPGSRLRF